MIKKHFKNAGISLREGTLTVTESWYSPNTNHRNVDLEINENGFIKVTAEKVLYEINMFNDFTDVDAVVEECTELYKKWPWSKPVRRVMRQCVVQLKKTEPRIYRSNSYILVEHKSNI